MLSKLTRSEADTQHLGFFDNGCIRGNIFQFSCHVFQRDGGADIILIPEIPYDIDKVVEAIEERHKGGSKFTILAVAEGAISKEDAALSKKEYKEKMKNYTYPSVSYEIAEPPFVRIPEKSLLVSIRKSP